MTALEIGQMALARIGAQTISAFDENSPQAIQVNLQYDPTRRALLRSHVWRFAAARETLTVSGTTPEFQWDFQYPLPDDFLRITGLFNTDSSYELEGELLLTDDSTVELFFVKDVEDPDLFDDLFIEVFSLALAIKIAMPLTGADLTIKKELQSELRSVISEARLVNFDEIDTRGRLDYNLWTDARVGPTTLGRVKIEGVPL